MTYKFPILALCVGVVSGCSWQGSDNDLSFTRVERAAVEGVAGTAWTPVTLAQHLGRGFCGRNLPRHLATEATETGMKFKAKC